MIETYEQAQKWMAKNARNLGAAYLAGEEQVDRLFRAYGTCIEYSKEHPELIDVVGDMLIGAINAFEVFEDAKHFKLATINALLVHPGKEAHDG